MAETTTEFHERQGGDCLKIGNWHLYSNGAMREHAMYGKWIEPPDDEYERAKLVVKFHEESVRRAEKAFFDKKDQLLAWSRAQQAAGYGAEDQDALDELKKLKAEVAKRRRNLAAAQKTLEKVTPEEELEVEEELEDDDGDEQFIADVENLKI